MWVVQRRPVSAKSLSTSPIPRQPLLLILFPLPSALSTTPKDKQIKPKTILLLSHLIPSPYYPDNPISQISLTSSYGTHFLFFNSAYKSSEWRPEKRETVKYWRQSVDWILLDFDFWWWDFVEVWILCVCFNTILGWFRKRKHSVWLGLPAQLLNIFVNFFYQITSIFIISWFKLVLN